MADSFIDRIMGSSGQAQNERLMQLAQSPNAIANYANLQLFNNISNAGSSAIHRAITGEKKVNVQPLHDRVVVRPLEEAETMRGGLYIPDTAKEKPRRGTRGINSTDWR